LHIGGGVQLILIFQLSVIIGNEKLMEESSGKELTKHPNVNEKIKKLEEKLKGAVEELESLKKILK